MLHALSICIHFLPMVYTPNLAHLQRQTEIRGRWAAFLYGAVLYTRGSAGHWHTGGSLKILAGLAV
jgi:hypothetical protein